MILKNYINNTDDLLYLIIKRLEEGNDFVNSMITSVFDSWPRDDQSRDLYNKLAPEVYLLNLFREEVEERRLGGWNNWDVNDGGWCTQHPKEEAIEVLKKIFSKEV